MDSKKENTTKIYIIREHDKLCLLENIICNYNYNINFISTFETIVSNLIDSIILNQENNIRLYINTLKYYISETKILNFVVDISFSIAKQKPYLLNIEVNNKTKNYIKYINNNYILPLF